MRRTYIFVLIALCVTSACQKDIKTYKIADEKKMLEELKDEKGLTVEESRLLYAAIMRSGMAEAFGNKSMSLSGMTVGEVIEQQRQFESDEKKREAEQARLAAEAKAKEDALAAELRKTVAFSVYRKDFVPSDAMNGRFDDYITIGCVYENNSSKDVRAFTGDIKFTDLFGKQIFSSGVTISDPVATGRKAEWDGSIKFNQFIDSHQRLRNADLKDLKIIWVPKSIIFQDGTTLGEKGE